MIRILHQLNARRFRRLRQNELGEHLIRRALFCRLLEGLVKGNELVGAREPSLERPQHPERGHHALPLDCDSAPRHQAHHRVLLVYQLGCHLGALNLPCNRKALHSRRGVDGVAQKREFGLLRPDHRRNHRPGVYPYPELDGSPGLVVRVDVDALARLHDSPRKPRHVGGVHRIALLLHVGDRNVGVPYRLDLPHIVVLGELVEHAVHPGQHVRHKACLHFTRYGSESDDVAEEDGHALLALGLDLAACYQRLRDALGENVEEPLRLLQLRSSTQEALCHRSQLKVQHIELIQHLVVQLRKARPLAWVLRQAHSHQLRNLLRAP
mmetsp:Transcript_182/g.496  ORF Transcript_182/g.496 Transcript_182/m.496 type:complete len:324 (+) Transcript_182:388-1359(+)